MKTDLLRMAEVFYLGAGIVLAIAAAVNASLGLLGVGAYCLAAGCWFRMTRKEGSDAPAMDR